MDIMTPILDSIIIVTAAKAAHEANRVWCMANGDYSQPHWEDAPEWQQLSAIHGATAIFHNPKLTPQQSHEGWLAVKKADGWAYGPVKDPAAKTHPCFVPYGELPPAQRAKDHIFGGVVRSILNAARALAV